MATPPEVTTSTLQQQAWDAAARWADSDMPLAEIVRRVPADLADGVRAQAEAAVPARGRLFAGSLAFALAWAVAVDVSLLVIGSSAARPVPGLTVLICVGAVLVALVFGTVAGRHRVKERRIRWGHLRSQGLAAVAEDAARTVWSRQVGGRWRPYGPVPPAGTDQRAAEAWMRRLGAADGRLRVVVSAPSPDAIRRVAPGGPIVFLSADPDQPPDIDDAADDLGLAVFGVEHRTLIAHSALARQVVDALRNGAGAPADLLSPAERTTPG
ncbi:hypothetical protein GIS00_07995 [Nakamurella sp. YIM 132087]|uniref:Uncharacterized protein n=1 Tax=Nakamurella alba TaxID=2665158 RepID=A0A7K1FIE1_9ACTN|nr:hypothetical protein [Nakamurella alba]MTD13882.1 hypothetical protein [Nakamurella alba]